MRSGSWAIRLASALIVAVGAFVFLWLITGIVDVVELPPPPSTAITITSRELHAELWPVIADYVRQKHGWSEDMYRIEFDREEGTALAFTVHHRDDDKLAAYPGGGRSFEVLVDPGERQVTTELHFE